MEDVELAIPLNPIENLCKEFAIEIPEKLETTFAPDECIYKAPGALRNLNRAAYTPRVISIGPFHHGNEKLKPMEIQKLRYLIEFLKRLRAQTKEQEQVFSELKNTIKGHEADIRRCYAASTFKLCSDRFVKMILLDAVFIFELLLRNKDNVGGICCYQNDFIIGRPWLRAAIQRDLILLENQLPFSILQKLYALATKCSMADHPSFLELSCDYFEKFNKNKPKPNKTLHFTDLVRYFLSFKHPGLQSTDKEEIKNLYSATMLHQAGVKFKALKDPIECLLDIRAWNSVPEGKGNPIKKGKLHMHFVSKEKGNPIKKGELHMPPLEIDNSTECLFRNLMALEQCHYPREEFICRYVKLLDFLVDIEKDVDLLIANKVIVSRLGDSKSVAKLINRLCLEIEEVTSGYDALSKLLNDYYESSWNKNKAYLVSVYFQNVWTGTGTVVGLIILAITVTRFILFFFR